MKWTELPTGSARVRAICGGLLILALVPVLSLTALYKVCTGFRFWDDMGYVMLTQKTFAAGHPLYDQTFTQYGPAYYAWKQVLHGVTRLPLSHNSTVLFTTASWVATSLLCAGYVARMTRNTFLSALACFSVFCVLQVLAYEPGHPQELCAVLLGGMLFASSFLTSGRHMGLILGAIGFLIGLLGMTKPNLGVYAALAGWVSLSNLIADRRSRRLLFGAGAMSALVLPIVLMRHNLATAGDYCILESGAVLLLVGRLAIAQPTRSLSLRTFAAPVCGFVAALLACAGYALAKGTSVRGLIHGLVLQHVDYDQTYFRWPEFPTEDVVLSLGLALTLWAATGPGLALWRRAPWVPTFIQFSAAPLLALVALLASLAAGPPFAWVKPAFTWCLPLVAATGHLAARQQASTWEAAPRQFAVSLAVLSALWGYPVWGSQAELSLFLLIPVAIVWSADALRYGAWPLRTTSGFSATRSQFMWRVLPGVATVAIVALALVIAHGAAREYRRLEPSGLPGSSLLRLPRDQSVFYRRVIQTAHTRGRAFFTMPGLGSLYFWAEQAPPTCRNAGNWMTLFNAEMQSRVVEDLQHTPELCVIRWNPVVKFWTGGRDLSSNRIVRYIEDNYIAVESFEGCDIMVRRRAVVQTGAGPT